MSATDTLVVTGSEAAAAIGVDSFKSPVALWAEKLGLDVPREPGESAYWGTLLQPLVAEEVERRGYAVLPAPADAIVSEEFPWLTGHPDGFCVRYKDNPDYVETQTRGIIEIKTTSPYRRGEWEDEQVPAHVYVQATVYMMLTGLRWSLAACLVGGQRLELREMEYDPEMASIIADRTRAFLQHVADRNPPPPRHDDSELLAGLYPQGSGEIIQLTTEMHAVAVQYEKLRVQKKEVAEQKDTLGNTLRQFMGEASIGQFEGAKVVTISDVNRKAYEVPAKSYRQLRVRP